MELKTIYSSNIPIDCHILKGRLESDGVECFIFDENTISVHPFWAVAVGGVKLKVPSNQVKVAEKIISLLKSNILIDVDGEYESSTVLENEINRQKEILEIKFSIRNEPSLIDKPEYFKPVSITQEEIIDIIESERKFLEYSKIKLEFTFEKFTLELFDYKRSIFKYLRVRPVEYYLDKEMVDNYYSVTKSESNRICPNCKSQNVKYGYAIDFKWDIPYLIFSLLIIAPFPLIRKKCHCFNCGSDFKNSVDHHKE